MASRTSTLRPLSCWKALIRQSRRQKETTRSLSMYRQPPRAPKISPSTDSTLPPSMLTTAAPHVNRRIKTFPPPPSPTKLYKDPVSSVHASQIALLDPSGQRTQLFSKNNTECAKVGDILLVRQKNGDPFAGVCMNIRRRGVDTGILLRNELTRVGVEMWYKIYSPNVDGIEIVQRRAKRARRARLTYLRKPKHDMGSVQGIVLQYQRSKNAIRSGGREQSGGKKKVKGKGRK